MRQFLEIRGSREDDIDDDDLGGGEDALDRDALTSVLVLAIHQLTYARFSPDRLFADEDQAAEFLARRVRVAEKQQSGEEYPVTEKATRSVPPKERAFLEGLVGEALKGSTPEGELDTTKDSYPQLVAFAKHRVMGRLGSLGVSVW